MPTRFSRLLATLIVAAAMARRGRGRRREPRAKPRRRRREPTPFALIVAGQIRMLRDPRLLENWRTSVLEPLRPAVFNGACGEAADAVLAQCKCRRTLTTNFGEVCVERCCAPRRKKGRKGGPHLTGWFHRKKHPTRKSYRPRPG